MGFFSNVGNWLYDNIIDPVGNWIEDTFVGQRAANETNRSIANQNVNLTRETNAQNLAFQKEENDITRMREDNAVQRAAIDMQRAGLSKTLAAGSPASAAALSPATMVAPHNDYQAQKVAKGLALINMQSALSDLALKKAQIADVKESIMQKAAQTSNVKAQTEGINLDNKFKFDQNMVDLDVKRSQIKLNESTFDYNIARTKLSNIESENYVRKLDATINEITSNINLNEANRSYVFEKILTEAKSRGLIDKQNEQFTINYLNQKLNYDINEWNLKYAKSHIKPVNYNYSTTDATIIGVLGSLLRGGFGSGSNVSFNPNWL